MQSYRSCNSRGLATSGEYLQLHNRLPWKPWRPLLERTHDRCLPQRLRRLAHKYTGPPLLNDVTSLPPDHSNSHPLFLYKPGPPWPIEMTKHWTPPPPQRAPIPPPFGLFLDFCLFNNPCPVELRGPPHLETPIPPSNPRI
jgi:hypothetical protein